MPLITVDRLRAIAAELPVVQGENLELLRSSTNRSIEAGTVGLEGAFRTQGVVAFLEAGDLQGFFDGMYLAAATRLRFLRCVRAGMPTLPNYLLAVYDPAIFEALCSGDAEVLRELAQDKQTLAIDARLDSAHEPYFAMGLRLLILGHAEPARRTLAHFEQNRGDAMEGESMIVRGILDGDAAGFNAGLEQALAERALVIEEGVDINVGEQWLAVEVLGLARLGRRAGLEVTARHPLLPHELLGFPPGPPPRAGGVLPPIPDAFVDVPPRGGV